MSFSSSSYSSSSSSSSSINLMDNIQRFFFSRTKFDSLQNQWPKTYLTLILHERLLVLFPNVNQGIPRPIVVRLANLSSHSQRTKRSLVPLSAHALSGKRLTNEFFSIYKSWKLNPNHLLNWRNVRQLHRPWLWVIINWHNTLLFICGTGNETRLEQEIMNGIVNLCIHWPACWKSMSSLIVNQIIHITRPILLVPFSNICSQLVFVWYAVNIRLGWSLKDWDYL